MGGDEKKPLGRILLARKLVKKEDLERALVESPKRGEEAQPLASKLVEGGHLQQNDALKALSEQFGVPAMDVQRVRILCEHLDVMPRELAEAHLVLPILVDEERLLVAMGDPGDKNILEELEFVTGKKVYPHVAVAVQLKRAIDEAYAAKAEGKLEYMGPNAEPPSEASKKTPMRRSSEWVILAEDLEAAKMKQSKEKLTELADAENESFTGARPASSSQKSAEAIKGRILVVDDDLDIRKMLKRLFEGKGFMVLEAERGGLALQMIKDEMPDLVVLDAMLPEVHGFDVARRIKGSEKYGAIPIIMMSAVYRGWRIAEDMKESCGIVAFLEKPFPVNEMMEKVTQALSAARGRNSVAPPRDPEEIGREAKQALDEGLLAYRQGKVEDAIVALTRGTKLDPLSYQLHFQLALLHGKHGNVYEAIQELEKAVELNRRHFASLKNLAVLYERAGFRYKAVEMWERCAHVAPDDATKAQVKEHVMRLL